MKFYIRKIIFVFSIIPYSFVISLLFFYFHAARVLGFYPTPYNPDPKDLAIYEIYGYFINSTFILSLFSLFVWLILAGFYIYSKEVKRSDYLVVTVGLIGYALSIFLVFSSIFEWYLD